MVKEVQQENFVRDARGLDKISPESDLQQEDLVQDTEEFEEFDESALEGLESMTD